MSAKFARAAKWTAGLAVKFVSVALVVGLGSVLLIRIVPGDPAISILGKSATPESLAALRHLLGTDRPLPTQILHTASELAHFSLGYSFSQPGRPVTQIVLPPLVVTLALVAVTLLIAMCLGLTLGLASALSRSSVLDPSIRFLNVVLLASPPAFVGLILLLTIGLRAHLSPVGGWAGSWPANLEYLWLPGLALSLYLVPLIARAERHAAREAMGEQFFEAAIARGLPRRAIVINHILPNSLLPVVTLVGYSGASLIGGVVVIEAVFGLPGIGSQLVFAVQARDYPVIVGIAVVTGLVVVAFNALTDLVYMVIDPRVRLNA